MTAAARKIKSRIARFFTALRVGLILAVKEITRTSKWTTILIVFVMTLTFLNLIVVRGILVGLIEGSIVAHRTRDSGDILLSTLKDKDYINNSPQIIDLLKSIPSVEAISPRYETGGKVEAGYKAKIKPTDNSETLGANIIGINPANELQVTHLDQKLVEGQFLAPGDQDQVVLGASLLYKYNPNDSPGSATIKSAGVGDKILLMVNNTVREVTIKGVLKTKVSIDSSVLMSDSDLRSILNRTDYGVNEIAVLLKPGTDPNSVKQILIDNGVNQYAIVQTAVESVPKFVNDVTVTFSLLGNIIGGIGLVVASITIFIVIFVNAITRRKFIGILKGIGISAQAIEFSYIVQAMFYAISGMIVGTLIIFFLLKPYFDGHPIDFPFSDGILVVDTASVAIRAFILLIATIIAGFIPARLVISQNTLDAILGR